MKPFDTFSGKLAFTAIHEPSQLTRIMAGCPICAHTTSATVLLTSNSTLFEYYVIRPERERDRESMPGSGHDSSIANHRAKGTTKITREQQTEQCIALACKLVA